jgi:hypothetical protein
MAKNQSKLITKGSLTEDVDYIVLTGRVLLTENVGPLVVLNAKGSISESIEKESIENLEDSSS